MKLLHSFQLTGGQKNLSAGQLKIVLVSQFFHQPVDGPQ